MKAPFLEHPIHRSLLGAISALTMLLGGLLLLLSFVLREGGSSVIAR